MSPRLLPYALIAPATVFTAALFLYPFALVAQQAFTGSDGAFSLAHFRTMAEHWKFESALTNTLWLAAIVVPLQLCLALALAQAGPQDVIAVLGKGHETGQIVGDTVLPFDDRAVLRELLG